ncbi:MAG: arylsulfatase [Cytophagales bacterium]|nr:arylsulfatase [Cytophagales bacterium]
MKGLGTIALFALTLMSVGCNNQSEKEKPMNVILIITDDQGYGDLAFHGNPEIETPVLDQFEKESTEFTRFYVSPVCAPTRASLLTGRYHLRTGTSWVTHRKEVMQSEEVTLAEVFKENGYRTGLFGKWHNGKQYPHDPIGQGFEQFIGFTDGHLNNYFDPVLTSQFEEQKMEGYSTDIFTDHAIDFMTDQEAPFFSMISYNTPHSPFQVADKYYNKYKTRGLNDKGATVYGMVENIDENIGRIRNHLQEIGLANNTMIIFMTDNGPNGWRYNNGLKGRKAHVDEGGVRVPFIIHHPQKPDWSNQKINEMAAHIDVLPTLADLLSLQTPKDLAMDGISLVPMLSGEKSEDRFFFTHQVSWDFDTIPGAIRNHEFVLTRKRDGDELYQLIDDSVQHHNLAQERPELVRELAENYEKWLSDVTSEGLIPPPIEVGHLKVPLIVFPAPDASSFIDLTFKGGSGWANDWFVGWQKDSKATWNIKVVSEMAYEVLLELSVPSAAGQFSLHCHDKTITLEINSPYEATTVVNQDRVPRGEVEEKVWPLVSMGKLKLPIGNHELTLAANTEMDSLMEVKSIKMVPSN